MRHETGNRDKDRETDNRAAYATAGDAPIEGCTSKDDQEISHQIKRGPFEICVM